MARIKRRWTVEHEWTCSACKKKNLGRHLSCSSCGKPKGGEAYDERGAETKPAVTDARVLAESRRGKNWACAFCDYENRGDGKACGKCGAPGVSLASFDTDPPTGCAVLPDAVLPDPATFRSKTIPKTELPPDVVEAFDSGSMTNEQMLTLLGKTSEPDPKRTFTGGDYRTAPKVEIEAPAHVFGDDLDDTLGPPILYEGRAEGEKRVRRNLVIGAVLMVVVPLIGVVTWLLTPWNENVHVEARSWTRTIELQERTTRSGSGWDDDRPPSHFNDSCETRQHGTHDCNPYDCHPHTVDCRCHSVETGESCHTSCTSGSNGFSECEETCTPTYREECDTCTEYDTCYEQCPTWDQWCQYNYYEWPTIRTEHTSGSGEDPVVWPSLAVDPHAANPQRLVPHETYRVVFRNDSGSWPYDPMGEGDYARFGLRETWVIEVNRAGRVRPLHSGAE